MAFETVANVIDGVFDAEAIAGLALFAIVIGVLVRALIALIAEHRRGERNSHRQVPR